MTALLAAAPILLAFAVLLLGRPATWAAAAGLAAAVLVAVLAFPAPLPALTASAADYAPLVVEVLLILLFGMALARLLEASGAMAILSTGLRAVSTSRAGGTALLVFGVVPFAESVTGYGIGVTVGVPVLVHLGHSVPRAALLGLLGLIAVPWGALGPGTAVAASLAGLGLDELGVATALVNVIPVLVAVVAVSILCGARTDLRVAVPQAVGGLVLFAGVLGANLLFGTPPAGILGSLAVIAVLLGWARLRGAAAPRVPHMLRAALPYLVLTAGVLGAQLLAGLRAAWWTELLASPPVWLALACAVAVPAAPGPVDGPAVLARAARAWVPVGAATGLFMVLGWLMTTTGMSTAIGSALAVLGAAPGPVLLALGGILTGSNTGANAMFAGTVAALAESTGGSTLGLVALGNAAGAFANIATPPRVALAVQIGAGDAPRDDAARAALARDTAWVLRRALLCVLAATVPFAAAAAVIG